MADRSRRRFRGASSAKRQVTWVAPADQGYLAVASNTKVLLSTFDPAAFGLIKPTIVRVRGQINIRPEAFTADVDITGAYGVAVVSDQAVAAGIASIPGPFTDAEWDGWFVWQAFAMHLQITSPVESFMIVDGRETIDSKAMRKITDNETMVTVVESQSGAFRISAPKRTLVMLS